MEPRRASKPLRVARRRVAAVGVAVAVGLLVGWVLLASGVTLRRVTSGSMVPTYPVGSWVVTRERGGIGAGGVKRGDVIVFRYPFGSELRAIKRVVAIPGDGVELHPTRLVVNGRAVEVEPADRRYDERSSDDQVEEIAPGTVFLLGDNSGDSIDSRSFGPLPQDELAGRVLFRLPASPLVLFAATAGVVGLAACATELVRRHGTRRVLHVDCLMW